MSVDSFFAGLGWRRYSDWRDGAVALYELKIDAPPCACNDRTVIHAAHYCTAIQGQFSESIEFSISAEASDGLWFALKAYSCRPEDLTPPHVHSIKRRLVAAWEAVAKGSEPDATEPRQHVSEARRPDERNLNGR